MSLFPFRCVAFDLDGTVADTAPDLATALNHTLAVMGRRQLPLDEVRAMVGHGTRALLSRGLAATGASDDALVDKGYPILMRQYEDHICELTRAYPGVEHAMDRLAKLGVALAICTNKPERAAQRLVNALGWGGRFAAVVGGDTLPVAKPDPAPLRYAIERAGGGPAAMVGDSSVDMQTAKAADIPGIAVTFGYADRPIAQLGAIVTIGHFDALFDALQDAAKSARLN
jgi:phosphoglycolate phosphatase